MVKSFKQVFDNTVWILVIIGLILALVVFLLFSFANRKDVITVINSPDYGIITSHFPQTINYIRIGDKENLLDCRKLSDNYRNERQKQGSVCYGIEIPVADNRRMVVLTGNGVDTSISHDEKIQLYSDQIMYNLPLERFRVDNFPVNFHGTRVVEEGKEDYVYYSGLVYKGANVYSITFEGYFDDDIKNILNILDFE